MTLLKNLIQEKETPSPPPSKSDSIDELPAEQQAFYYDQGYQDAIKKNYKNISNIKGRVYYEKGYKDSKEMLFNLFEEDVEANEVMKDKI